MSWRTKRNRFPGPVVLVVLVVPTLSEPNETHPSKPQVLLRGRALLPHVQPTGRTGDVKRQMAKGGELSQVQRIGITTRESGHPAHVACVYLSVE